MKDTTLLKRIRFLLVFFMIALTLSGLTAIPLQQELALLNLCVGAVSSLPHMWPSMAEWISRVHAGVQKGYGQFSLLAYGTDWLTLAYVVIAVAFIGPVRDPLKNIWVVEFGMIACMSSFRGP